MAELGYCWVEFDSSFSVVEYCKDIFKIQNDISYRAGLTYDLIKF